MLLATWATVMLTTGAHAEPVTIALFGAAFAATLPGAIVSTLLGVAGSFLINTIFTLLYPADEEADKESNPTEVQYGDRVPRAGLIGTQRLGGHKVHYNEYDDAKWLQIVHVLADGWCEGLNSIYINNRQYQLQEVANSGNNEARNYIVLDFPSDEDYDGPTGAGLVQVRFHDGRPGQLPDTNLITQTPSWDSTYTYSHMCYVVVECKNKREAWNGIPDFQFVLDGFRCYDPRLDDTVGGSGAHRFNDPTTWEFTKNVAVGAYHFVRGFFANGHRILGAGLPSADLILDTFVSAMNVCDEGLSVPGGGSRARYEMCLYWEDTEVYADVLDRMCKAMGGFFCEKQGQIAIFPGKAQTVVKTITDDDLTVDSRVSFSPKRSSSGIYNIIQGTYTHSEDFQPSPYTEIAPAAFIAEDDGEEIVKAVNFDEVQHPHQAYMLAKLVLYQSRLQATASICLDIKDMIVEVGDWITWNSANALRGNRTYRITGSKFNLKKMQLELKLQEISAAAFADDATAEDVVEPVRQHPLQGYLNTVTGFTIEPTTLVSPSGATLPALAFHYDPITDPAVRAVEIQYRVIEESPDPAGPWIKVIDMSPDDGFFYSSQGVTPGRIHEATARLIGLPGRTYDFLTPNETAAFPTSDVTSVTEVADNSITIAKLTQDLKNVVGVVTGTGPGTVAQAIADLEEEIARQASASLADQMTNKRKTELLSVRVGSAIAAVIREQSARVTADSAMAEALEQVVAQFENSIAQGLLQFSVIASDGGANATIALKVRASVDDVAAEAGLYLQAHADGLGGTTAEILLLADNIFFSNGVDSASAVTIDGSGNVIFKTGYFETLQSTAQTTLGDPIILIDGVTGNQHTLIES